MVQHACFFYLHYCHPVPSAGKEHCAVFVILPWVTRKYLIWLVIEAATVGKMRSYVMHTLFYRISYIMLWFVLFKWPLCMERRHYWNHTGAILIPLRPLIPLLSATKEILTHLQLCWWWKWGQWWYNLSITNNWTLGHLLKCLVRATKTTPPREKSRGHLHVVCRPYLKST